jgi:hypothetical protein
VFKKMTFYLLSVPFLILGFSSWAYAQQKTTTTTTTVESKTQTKTPVKKKAAETTSVMSTTTTTEVAPPPMKEVIHKPYDEEMLKKMSDTLCTEGFEAYVGTEKKNVCLGKAVPPDIAYSCVWDKDGPAVFTPTRQGPCSLDYTEHRGSITIKKDNYASDPPLGYGKEVQCCFRPAKGLEQASVPNQ